MDRKAIRGIWMMHEIMGAVSVRGLNSVDCPYRDFFARWTLPSRIMLGSPLRPTYMHASTGMRAGKATGLYERMRWYAGAGRKFGALRGSSIAAVRHSGEWGGGEREIDLCPSSRCRALRSRESPESFLSRILYDGRWEGAIRGNMQPLFTSFPCYAIFLYKSTIYRIVHEFFFQYSALRFYCCCPFSTKYR